jgi:hypothetical protein
VTEESWRGLPVVHSIGGAGPRQRLVTEGTVRSVRTRTSPWVRCEISVDDGTGMVGLWFIGRRNVPGLVVGARVAFEGTTQAPRGTSLVVLNPIHRIVAPPVC